jgi:hypothetical protein
VNLRPAAPAASAPRSGRHCGGLSDIAARCSSTRHSPYHWASAQVRTPRL